MGLGKTLSVLALIAWHLDSMEHQNVAACATLVVTTLSSKNHYSIWKENEFTDKRKQLQVGSSKLNGISPLSYYEGLF
jgi:SNF2 family DNA or RNA helicase